jgi:hypothetical protein
VDAVDRGERVESGTSFAFQDFEEFRRTCQGLHAVACPVAGSLGSIAIRHPIAFAPLD